MKNNSRIPKPRWIKFPIKPNLRNYGSACRNFQWKTFEKKIGLPLKEAGFNLAAYCIDRHLQGDRKNKVALFWEGTDGTRETYTFFELSRRTNQFANVLVKLGVRKKDRVFVFLDRIPELYIAVFGALKRGAIVGPLFSAFGPEAIRDRLADSGAKVMVTSVKLLPRLNEVRHALPELKHVIVVSRGSNGTPEPVVTLVWEKLMAGASEKFRIPWTTKNDFSIMHYTSGTTGKPKGAVHAHGSLPAQYLTAHYTLDLQPEDVYWCTADPGWVTGTSYGMIGPWSNGISILVYEGGFNPERWYRIIQNYRVSVWYSAPTAIRMLMKAGEELPRRFDLSSLRHIASVGEPLNPEAIVWGQKVFKPPIHDNWWQTETGAIMIANFPVMEIRLGSMGKPIPGIEAAVCDEKGRRLPPGEEGDLCLKPGWPSMFRTYWRKKGLYNSRFRNGWYVTGDRARQDQNGYFWFIGRADDVINTAGHLVGPFEVESALIEHPAIAEAGVIGKPDPERMEVVKAFVSLRPGYLPSPGLATEIQQFVKTRLAAHAYPREVEFIDSLPKTRSGKIMRRLLKARELGLPLGDTSTLEEV